jgi:concanavalin A-like lectin/glucanase superfamily protein/F5/8 type C domain-containing protein
MCMKRHYLILLVLILGLGVELAGAAGLKPDVLWWAFDEGSGTVATDGSGSGHDGVITGAEWTVPGALATGSALYFDGTGDIVEDDDAENYLNGLEAVTIAVWIKADAIPTDKGFIIAAPPAGADSFCTMRYDAAGANAGGASVLKMAVTSTGGEQQLESSANLQTTEWQHVAMTWSSGQPLTFYVDGVEGTPSDNYAGMEGTISGCTTLIVGQGGKDAGISWAGLIDDVQIYSRALMLEEIQAVMLGLGPAELASEPIPLDEATDVPRDVVLGWIPGEAASTHDVYLGTVLDDVNTADRANPLGVLVSQGQADATYASDGVLEFGQTYYWRVDEVNAAPDNTIFTGEIWSFTVEPFAYAIEGVIATSNATSGEGAGPERTVDGSGLNASDQHSVASTDMWLGDAGADAVWLQYEFDSVYKLYEMLIWNYNVMFEPVLGFGPKDVTIEYSEDGVDWIILGDVEFAQATAKADYAANTTVAFEGAAVKFVKITINSNRSGLSQYGLSEVRFLQIPVLPREPQPASGAANVTVDSTLAWRAGREAVTHDVYLGTDAEAMSLAVSTDAASYDPGALNLETTYYWRIDEVNEAEAVSLWEGDVWSFSTQQFLVVDDFESYNDEDNVIYETWIDGWVNETGSMVGYLEAPFTEQTIVNSGSQSMPLFYDNTSTATSEIDFDLAQNWTVNGIESLSLQFRGDPDNTGQLYVKINNTKVSYDGDLTTAVWQPMAIDLSTVGGNLSNVSSLTIGVEGAGAEGVVYIDDIRLYGRVPEYIAPVELDSAGLLAHYDFEGSANDSSGNGLDGAIVDGELVSPGKLGEGMAVQVNDAGYVDLGNPASLDFSTGDWTVSAWYKTGMTGTGDDNKGTIYAKGGDSGGGHRYCLIMSEVTEGVISLVTDDNATKFVVDSTSVTNDDEWHSVVGQRDGTELNIFIDGLLEGTDTASADYDLAGTVQHNAYIGAVTNNGDGSLYKLFIGLLDDVRVYDSALSEGEILWLAGRTAPVAKPF